MLREFRVGYAPSAWDRLLLGPRRAGFGDREIYDAGLSQRNAAGQAPTTASAGGSCSRWPTAAAACSASARRALGADQQPKYLNTSENEVFHKGRQLFGADVARAPAAKAGQTIVCEGYTDVIALHQAGLRNAVGIMGTAMTPEQVEALAGLAPAVLLALDADNAGQEAMLRAARVAASRKLELRVVPLPVGSDPADLVQRDGAEAMTKLVGESVPLVQFQVERTLATADLSGARGQGPRDRRPAPGVHGARAVGACARSCSGSSPRGWTCPTRSPPSCCRARRSPRPAAGRAAPVAPEAAAPRPAAGQRRSARGLAGRAHRADVPRAVHRAARPWVARRWGA